MIPKFHKKGRGSSLYRGVSYNKQHDRWKAYITICGETKQRIKFLGYADTELKCLKLVNDACRKYYPNRPDLIQRRVRNLKQPKKELCLAELFNRGKLF